MTTMNSYKLEGIRQAKELAKNAYLRYQETGEIDQDFRYVFPRVFEAVRDQYTNCVEIVHGREYLKEECFHQIMGDIQKLTIALESSELKELYIEAANQLSEKELGKPVLVNYSYIGSGKGKPDYEYVVKFDSQNRTTNILRGYIKLVDGETHDIETE